MRSLSKPIGDIVSNDRLLNDDTTGFTETQINPSDSTWKTIEMLNLFNFNFNNNKNKVLSLGYRCRNDVAVLDKFDVNEVSIFSFKKYGILNMISRNMSILFSIS